MKPSAILIIGLGQIGGSLASALKKAHWKGKIYGVDKKKEVLRKAVSSKILDDGGTKKWRRFASHSDIVILATPVPSILRLILPAAKSMKDGAILLDVGSTKFKVSSVMRKLPKRIVPIGGHPVCGTEKEGPSSWNASLFSGKKFILCPLRRERKTELGVVKGLIRSIGGLPIEMGPRVHDRVFALTSHLPYVISLALMEMLSGERKKVSETDSCVGGSFLSATRVALSSPEMALGILETNSSEVQKRIHELKRELEAISGMLKRGNALRAKVIKAKTVRKLLEPK